MNSPAGTYTCKIASKCFDVVLEVRTAASGVNNIGEERNEEIDFIQECFNPVIDLRMTRGLVNTDESTDRQV